MREPDIALEGVGRLIGKYGSIDTAGAPFMEALLEDFNITIESSEADLFAGEGKYAIERATTQRTITMGATSALIRIQDVKLTLGHDDDDDAIGTDVVPMVVFREQVTCALSVAFDDLDKVTAVTGPAVAGCYRESENVIIEYADGSGRLTKGSTAAEGVFVEDTSGKAWTFHANDVDKLLVFTYVYNYDYNANHESDNITSKYINTNRENCSFAMLYSKLFEACSVTKMFQVYFMKALASGSFTIPFANGDYNKPAFELSAIDPMLPSGRVGIVTIQNDAS